MMKAHQTSLALFNIGGGEIILILAGLFILGLVAVGALGLVYLVVRAGQSRPAPAAPTLVPPQIRQSLPNRDLEHVRLLAIFHFALAGLALMGCAILGLHYLMMRSIVFNPDFWSHQGGQPPPPAFLNFFVWFYVFGGLVLGVSLVLNGVSGLFLLKRRHRLFSLIVAGLNCLHVPFGTTLGIFTFIVLSRESVRELYRNEGS